MSDYRIAIPSRGRPDIVTTRTLPLLRDRGIDVRTKVRLYVPREERGAYHEANHAAGFLGLEIHPADVGMNAARNSILLDHKDGERLVQCDDDLIDIKRLAGDRKLVPVDDLAALFAEGFAAMEMAGATLWGPYPSANPLSMKAGIDSGLGLVAGPMFGHVVDRNMLISVPAKTDYEFTLLHWEKDGALARLRDVCVITKYRQRGGLGEGDARWEAEAKGCRRLLHRYPQWLRRAPERSSGFPELKFRRPRGPARPPA